MRRQAVEREDIVSSTKEREGSEERMGGCKTREGRLRRCYSAMRLICMRSARPNFAQIALHCIALRGITMVLHSPMEKARKRSNQKLVSPSPSASSSSPVILRPFSSSYPLLSSLWSMATHASIIYAAQVAWNFTVSYIILAHTFLYTWTRVCYEGAHVTVCSQEETGRYTCIDTRPVPR